MRIITRVFGAWFAHPTHMNDLTPHLSFELFYLLGKDAKDRNLVTGIYMPVGTRGIINTVFDGEKKRSPVDIACPRLR